MNRTVRNRKTVLKNLTDEIEALRTTLSALDKKNRKYASIEPGLYRYVGKKFIRSTREHKECTMLVRIDDYNDEGFIGVVLAAECDSDDIMNSTNRVQEKAISIKWDEKLDPVQIPDLPLFASMKFCTTELEQLLKEV